MSIIVNLDVMMTKRKISLNALSERVDLALSNLSILKTGKSKAWQKTVKCMAASYKASKYKK